MSLPFEKVLRMLNDTTKYLDDCRNTTEIKLINSDFQSPLKTRLENRLQLYKKPETKLSFDKLRYHKIEIGQLNGNQILRLLVSITNDKKALKDGDCFMFHVNNQEDTALIVLNKNYHVECRALVSDVPEKKGYWARMFDDKYCEERSMDTYYTRYDSESLKELRKPLAEQYKKYMQERVVTVEPQNRQLFFGVVFEIAKCHIRHWKVYNDLKNFPKAALIKLAIDNGLSGKLQPVFNDHKLADVYEEMKLNHSRKKDALDKFHEYKAQLRLEGAKNIINSVFPPNAEENYNEAEVKKALQDIKKFYE